MAYEVGCTYLRKVGDKTEPVSLTSVCEWGGWYGVTDDGNTVRVTDKTLVGGGSLIRESLITNTVQEDTPMASNSRRTAVTAEERRRRRGVSSNGTTATLTVTESGAKQVEVATDGKVTAEEILAAAKPAAAKRSPKPKAAAKQPATPNSTESKSTKEINTMPVQSKPAAARRTRKPKAQPAAEPAVETITVTATDLEAMVERLVSARIAELTPIVVENLDEEPVEEAPKPARKPRAKSAAKSKAKTVTLTADPEPRKHSWYFKYEGTAKAPLVTGCYVMHDAIEVLEGGAKEIVATFDRAEGKKHSILFREADDSRVFNGSIYLKRDALNGSGITEDTPITVKVTVKSENEITLTVSPA